MASQLKIKVIEPIAVSLPMKKPVQMAGETVARADNVLVRIEAENGMVGWGEAASAPTMTGETVASMMAAVAHMTPILLKRAVDDFAGASAAMHAAMYGNAGAKAAIDIALHDLVGRATGRPLHALFGPLKRQRMPVLAVVGSDDAEADLREAQARYEQGYRAFKIKVGLAAAEADAERTRRVCAALKAQSKEQGEACLVSADANQGYSADAALRYVGTLGECGLDFFEQPVAAHDLEGMARVAAAAPTLWIGADEGIHSADDLARHHAHKAARGASLKAIKLGGLRALFEAGQLCERLGMRINISCKTGESSVASAAAAHIAAVVPEIAWGLTVTSPGLAEDVVTAPLTVTNGHVVVPDGPGLGVEVDERRVRLREQAFKRVA
ncbi:MAG TPA: enolase C-terminal domain-like protein [Xanthobacteraceae bacterium]|nr:enolase C-terminal domain-like protein [Xanthobacteraceae bacterium]